MTSCFSSQEVKAALQIAVNELLACRNAQGIWTGELSSSALSTATASCALSIAALHGDRGIPQATIDNGLDWLVQNANSDGGWGDTTLSLSNISATTLCWAALGLSRKKRQTIALQKSENWIATRSGGIDPASIANIITASYGQDRTFSAPILTMCALAGRLGADRDAWWYVKQLPFELAACPRRWFTALRLPVVSYALPALIAIGQARHRHLPSRNPITRVLRNLTSNKTLQVLDEIQPSNGGFLEATPLTSFVTMSLAGNGLLDHAVCQRGIDFLLKSQRGDGSWPIDTNLNTWVTTLAINALGGLASEQERGATRQWLLDQQHRERHSYTNAAPGGWAWTNLPGGVPDADDTAGALTALKTLAPNDPETWQAAEAGIIWLLDLQNKDGGMPTFCRGWGTLPFDRSSADITAHALRAWSIWLSQATERVRSRIHQGSARAMTFLRRTQQPDGAWAPLWFGNQHHPNEANPTYGTARVLLSLAEIKLPAAQALIDSALPWLVRAQNSDGSWGGFPQAPGSVEETALAVEALAAANSPGRDLIAPLQRGVEWLVHRVQTGDWKQPAPIGFYFAKLWYFEKLYPMIFTVAALRRATKLLHEGVQQ